MPQCLQRIGTAWYQGWAMERLAAGLPGLLGKAISSPVLRCIPGPPKTGEFAVSFHCQSEDSGLHIISPWPAVSCSQSDCGFRIQVLAAMNMRVIATRKTAALDDTLPEPGAFEVGKTNHTSGVRRWPKYLRQPGPQDRAIVLMLYFEEFPPKTFGWLN